ncbi:HEAT repeat domain-containing protein [Streptomyces sp. NPDC088864]|uniref:HEAT repeat domain-containing protein n=1 Tax=Streptomyces sp. NPDC088864 TaxID=3365910 RepID=UPI003825894C
MNQSALLAELEQALRQRETTSDIVRRMAEPGAAAAPGLVAAVGTVSRSAFPELRTALRLIGPPAFDAALAARARAETVPDWWELGRVLRAFDERCLPQYVAALAHPMGDIRRQALGGLQNLKEAAAGALPDVLPFLADPDSYMRYTAENTVRAIGADAAPELLAIRRDGPARLRRHALTALALIGHAGDLDPRDLRALERLIRVKTATDTPCSLPDHQWLAVPGATYEGLFEAMGLHHRIPCTLSMGLSAMERDTAEVTAPDGTRRTAYRVFVTPELDGWRLVYADAPFPQSVGEFEDVLRRVSAACGEAQAFSQDEHSDSMLWAVALNGIPRRRYWRHMYPEWEGDLMDWEARLDDDAEDDPDDKEDDSDDDCEDDLDDLDDDASLATLECDVAVAARALSLHPVQVGPRTILRGHGWLATTDPETGHTAFAGALRV